MSEQVIPFNRPYLTGKEKQYVAEVNRFCGDGVYSKKCQEWFESNTATNKSLLTHSCTAALEMSALLLDIQAGDEVILPSYTFVSTANAFVLRGAVPVFVDVREDTLNLNEQLIEAAVTNKTKAIVPVHYAGVSCEMDSIISIANQHGLKIVEDAAQGVMSYYKGKALGTIGDLGTYSFHETKNIISGEGGALLINDPALAHRAEIIREKGTDRSRFIRGEVDKYTWQETGSSFLPNEITAAFLLAQLESAESITKSRLEVWGRYHVALQSLEDQQLLRRQSIPEQCQHNAHMYYIILAPEFNRERVLAKLRDKNIQAVSHYVPLHSSPGGLRYGRAHGDMRVTNSLSEQLVRLPLWVGLTAEQQMYVVDTLKEVLSTSHVLTQSQTLRV